jgi:NifB/MoaA-like Fe-S oxidoreductase
MLKITKVKRNSIAKELGLEVGDEITAFDGYPCEDELDYLYYCTQENFSMTVKDKRSGGQTTVEIEKYEGQKLVTLQKHAQKFQIVIARMESMLYHLKRNKVQEEDLELLVAIGVP